MYKKIRSFILVAVLALFILTACNTQSDVSTTTQTQVEMSTSDEAVIVSAVTDAATGTTSESSVLDTEVSTTVGAGSVTEAATANTADHDDAEDYVWDSSSVTQITLSGDAITVEGEGVDVNGRIATITAAGSYTLSGSFTEGQIIVDTDDEEIVQLILNGIDITNTSTAPIYIANANKTVIILAENSENRVTDGTTYVFENAEEDEPNAAIFSKDDLTIYGDGSLTVTANYNDGIASKDGLIISGGNITVNAADDGIRGKDYLIVKDGTITVTAQGDGLKADEDEDSTLGYISIESGTLNITSGGDAIQAATDVLIAGGAFTLTSGGGSNASLAADTSAKGIKGTVRVDIDGGTFNINSADDAIHSNSSITINGGDIVAASADDGVHADASLVISGGNLTITKSYEGLESGIIVINDGVIYVTASDDGINVSNGSGGFAGPGQAVSSNYYLEINGGTIVVDADGDGLDSNGLGTLNDGVVIVNGPVMNMNGALDVDGTLVVNGGFLVAVGSAGMAQNASTASTQYAVLETLSSVQAAGTMVHIESEDGAEILTFVPTKEFQTIVVSSPELTNGSTYVVYLGGSATGTVADGLYTDGTYTPGSQVSSFTITSIITGQGGQMGGPGGGGRPPRP